MKLQKKFIFLFILMLIFLILLAFYILNQIILKRELLEQTTQNILIIDNKINISSLTLKQKIAQMIMIRGDKKDLDFKKLNVGGIFLDRQNSEEAYVKLIKEYQNNSKIILFVSTDLEGAWNPFKNPQPRQIFPPFSEINTSEQAFIVGLTHGELLGDIGFNLNFAPVAELLDNAYGGRAFLGTNEQIKEKIKSYILGLQETVLGTCKHYPGKSMEKDLHKTVDYQIISKEDLSLFEICIENNISSIMVSHQIVSGELDSQGLPSSVSKDIISSIDNSTLIIIDEVNMRSLSNFYDNKVEMYRDLINAGGNLILDFELNSLELYALLLKLEKEAQRGKINMANIEFSTRKVLELKGYEVIN